MSMQHKSAAAALALLLGLAVNVVRADTVLVSDTTLVSGSESSVYSFVAPAAGTVSIQIDNLDWPQPLSSLSFMLATTSQVVSSWSDPGTPEGMTLTFQVPAGGRYFADVIAQAGGTLDLGVYSLAIDFCPTSTVVPLPATGGLLLTGIVAVLVLRRLRRPASRAEADAAPV